MVAHARSPYYAGPIHGQLDAATDDALRRFQADHGLAVDGAPGPDTRRALVTDYMAIDGTSLPPGTDVARHGCGEYHNAVPTPDETEEQANRRVEVFFFEGPIEPPPDQAPRMGLGLLISGVGALAGGVTFIVAAAGELAPGPSDGEGVVSEASDTAGLAGIGLGVGVAGMIAGLVMLPFGAVRLHRWRDWKRARPTVNRSAPGTWIAGVTLRF